MSESRRDLQVHTSNYEIALDVPFTAKRTKSNNRIYRSLGGSLQTGATRKLNCLFRVAAESCLCKRQSVESTDELIPGSAALTPMRAGAT
jgi:hypothetical protein